MKLVKFSLLKRILKYWFPVFLWAFIIFAFSSRPTSKVSEIHWEDFILKKSIHLFEYFTFCLLLFRALINNGTDVKNALFISFYSSLIYGLTDEFHQSFTPGRGPNLRDVVIDGIGAFFAIYFVSNLIYRLPQPVQTLLKKLEINKISK